MRLEFTWTAAALLASSCRAVKGLSLKAEHAGGVFNNGTAAGQDVSLGNGTLSELCRQCCCY